MDVKRRAGERLVNLDTKNQERDERQIIVILSVIAEDERNDAADLEKKSKHIFPSFRGLIGTL